MLGATAYAFAYRAHPAADGTARDHDVWGT
jgi:hypothetical protein